MVRHMNKIIPFDIRYAFMIGAIVVFSFAINSKPSCAAFAADACDPEYYESLKSRAWLEAQREITQNQNLIFKADSVLQYTCFDQFLGTLVANQGVLFSGSGPGNMALSLTALVGASVGSYGTSNFNHTMLGGRSTINAPLPAAVGAAAYNCNRMNQIWGIAKCMDFIPNPATDGFFTFAEYAAGPNDLRALPTQCANPVAVYQDELNIAVVHDPSDDPAAGPPDNVDETPWNEDDTVTYFDLIDPPAAAGNCGGPESRVATGLFISRNADELGNNVTRYHEKTCVVPGCFFVPTANRNITDDPSSQPGRCCLYNDFACP